MLAIQSTQPTKAVRPNYCRSLTGTIQLFIIVLFSILFTACEKLLDIPQPVDSITTEKVFKNDKAAESALMSVYSKLSNGAAATHFTNGLITTLAMASADEMVSNEFSYLYANQLQPVFAEMYGTQHIWRSAYSIGVFGANSILEGLAISEGLQPRTLSLIEGEAKFIRAFSYFYLTQFFGEVPLVLETDFNKSGYQPKAPISSLQQQMIADLKDAQRLLPSDFSTNGTLRIRANKWAATALLARVYLYSGDFTNAALEAEKVIQQDRMFSLMPNLNQVFLTNSKEAIWQLQHSNDNPQGNATTEGAYFLAQSHYPGVVFPAPEIPGGFISSYLLGAFEEDDQRKKDWLYYAVYSGDTFYYPHKYKTGLYNRVVGGTITEYYTPLRLAEQHLIKAEASVKAGLKTKAEAVEDINIVRRRAGLTDLPDNLTDQEFANALEREWQVEYFIEWGHRWLNLKRTGRATAVLSTIPYKQPWDGDRQLYYPIPLAELEKNPSLTQHEAYK